MHIYKWQAAEAGGFELSRVVGFDWGLILLSLRVRGEFVLVGDLMKSICLLRFNSEAQTLTEVGSAMSRAGLAEDLGVTVRSSGLDLLFLGWPTARPRQERGVDDRRRALG